MLFALTPCALLAGLLAFAAIAGIWHSPVSFKALVTIFILLLGTFLPVGTLLLLRQLTAEGYTARLRHLLFGFYLFVLLYCGAWTSGTASREEDTFLLLPEGLIVPTLALLLFPVCFTLFSSPIRSNPLQPAE